MTRGPVLATDLMDAAAFAPFGAFVLGPKLPGDRAYYTEWLGSPAAGATPSLHVNRIQPTTLPHQFNVVERHPFTAQFFIPLDVSRYLVTVMPATAAGDPDPAAALSFIVPGNVGVVYGAGVWHVGASVLDRDARFAVLMWRGSPADEVFVDIDGIEVRDGTIGAPAARRLVAGAETAT